MAVLDIMPLITVRLQTSTVNTSDIGSTVNYTYTAYADAAGNPGAKHKPHTVTVIDYKHS